MEQTIDYNHPVLGPMTGVLKCGGRVTQFRAIKFATIPGRFRQSVLLPTLPKRDFTTWGPVCPQAWTPNFVGGLAMGGQLQPEQRTYDEFECLNLTLTVPTYLLTQPNQDPVPVVAWVHGGAFRNGGGANYGLEDPYDFVDWSITIGKPVVFVGLQYRLNVFGFISSLELAEFARLNNEPIGNWGLRDLIVGYSWIKKFVRGFGGDERAVMTCGESAGAIAISLLVAADGLDSDPPFKRAIYQSGIASLLGPALVQTEQRVFDGIIKTISGDVPPEKRLETMLTLPWQAFMWDALPSSYRPVVDHDLFKEPLSVGMTCERTYNCAWLESFMAGDCGEEGHSFRGALGLDTGKVIDNLKNRLQLTFGSQIFNRLTEIATEFGCPSLSIPGATTLVSKQEIENAVHLLGAIMFHALQYAIVRVPGCDKRGKKAYLYHLDKKNPIFTPQTHYSGVSHHFVDNIYLFQSMVKKIADQPTVRNDPAKLLREYNTARSMATKWIDFAYGIEPWDENLVGVITEFGEGTWEVYSDEEDVRRNGRKIKAWLTLVG
ncbi:Alpha/Beta hydrolase protein [Lipomyces tetrasporus]